MRAFRSTLLVLMGICVVLGYGRTRAENLEAGKSAQKLFSSNCAQCHSNPRALAPRMSNWALTGFLQEHYTASPTAAYELAAYLTAIGNQSSRATEQPMARRDGPRQSWANQSRDPVERPPEIVPVR